MLNSHLLVFGAFVCLSLTKRVQCALGRRAFFVVFLFFWRDRVTVGLGNFDGCLSFACFLQLPCVFFGVQVGGVCEQVSDDITLIFEGDLLVDQESNCGLGLTGALVDLVRIVVEVLLEGLQVFCALLDVQVSSPLLLLGEMDSALAKALMNITDRIPQVGRGSLEGSREPSLFAVGRQLLERAAGILVEDVLEGLVLGEVRRRGGCRAVDS